MIRYAFCLSANEKGILIIFLKPSPSAMGAKFINKVKQNEVVVLLSSSFKTPISVIWKR